MLSVCWKDSLAGKLCTSHADAKGYDVHETPGGMTKQQHYSMIKDENMLAFP